MTEMFSVCLTSVNKCLQSPEQEPSPGAMDAPRVHPVREVHDRVRRVELWGGAVGNI